LASGGSACVGVGVPVAVEVAVELLDADELDVAVAVDDAVCVGVEDCRWLGVVLAGVVCVTVPRLVPVLGASAVDGRSDAVAGDAGWLAECDGDSVVPLFVDPWPFELISTTATTAATPHRATPTPAAARRRFPRGKPRARSE
jgi:hypothetical protein